MTTKNILSGAGIISLYLAGIIFSNLGFSYLPFFDTPFGVLPMMSFFVGFIFVIRDFAQRHVGNMIVLPVMILGIVISYYLADPRVAIASAAAFAAAEFVDWAVYTTTKKPFSERVLISSVYSVPVDSIVFLAGIGAFSFGSIFIMSLSKFAAAAIIWCYMRNHPFNAKV